MRAETLPIRLQEKEKEEEIETPSEAVSLIEEQAKFKPHPLLSFSLGNRHW